MKEYEKGIISGIGQSLSGHPFDTLKVKKQNNLPIKNINLKRLYKGLTFPLMSNAVIMSSQYYFYHNHSGILAGIISGMMIGPIDYLKVQKQISKNYKYKLRMPLGMNASILRETLAVPIYFNSYYKLNEKLNNSFISGGLAGVLSWLIPYPIDTIKSRMHAGYNFKDSIKMGNFSRGLSICLMRGFVANGVGFSLVEKLK
jgi:hypothetical protein